MLSKLLKNRIYGVRFFSRTIMIRVCVNAFVTPINIFIYLDLYLSTPLSLSLSLSVIVFVAKNSECNVRVYLILHVGVLSKLLNVCHVFDFFFFFFSSFVIVYVFVFLFLFFWQWYLTIIHAKTENVSTKHLMRCW